MGTSKTIVVTGASGFIGRHVVKLYLEAAWSVVALTRRADSLNDMCHSALEVVTWDLAEARKRLNVLYDADVLCHLAAYIPSDFNKSAEAQACFEVNAVGTADLLEAASEVGVPNIVSFSSGNAYAPGLGPVREEDPLYPNWRATYYLASKVAADAIADYHRRMQQMPITIFRLSTVYGPGMTTKSFIVRCIQRLTQGLPVELVQEGRHRADWVYVEDVARMVMHAVDQQVYGPVNLGSGRTHTMEEVVGCVAEVLNADPALVRRLPAEGTLDPTGFAELDISRARRELDFEPSPLKVGITQLCAWCTGLSSQNV